MPDLLMKTSHSECIVVLIRPILHLRFAVGPSAQRSWIGPHFFFSFELVLRETPRSPVFSALASLGGQVPPKGSCSPRPHCAQWPWWSRVTRHINNQLGQRLAV